MSRFSPGFIFPNGVAANTLVSTFIAQQFVNANQNPQTFNNGGAGFDMGAADPNCWVVAALYVGTAGARVPSGLTYGGQAMTLAGRVAIGTGRLVDIYYTNWTSGGANNFIASYGGTNNGAVGCWKIIGLLNTAGIVYDSTQPGPGYTGNIAVPKSGSCGIAVAVTSSGNAITFNEPTPTDYAANQTTATTYRYAGAHHDNLSAGTWAPDMSIAAGSGGFASAMFPPT